MMQNSKNYGKLGFASYPQAEDEEGPVRPYVPPEPKPAENPVAQIVTASLSAQAPTGGNAVPGNTPPAKVLYFPDEDSVTPYKAPIAEVIEKPVESSNLGLYVGGGLIAYALWRLFR